MFLSGRLWHYSSDQKAARPLWPALLAISVPARRIRSRIRWGGHASAESYWLGGRTTAMPKEFFR